MSHPLRHWITFWDYLDQRFWQHCRWMERELSREALRWQPTPAVASILWNLRHLGEMLDHYLANVFHARPATVADEPLVTMQDGARDDGRFDDLAAITSYHRQLRPAYRQFLESLTLADMDRPLSSRPDAHTVAWAVAHVAEHESYHLGKCRLLLALMKGK